MKEMLTRPNKEFRKGDPKIQPYDLGNNQLALRFKNRAFAILLNSDYYEGTEYGQYYNIIENGKSNIYVSQPETEKELDIFWKSDSNSIKYLVGYTGIGKTTVIRNHFKIFDRNIHIVNNSLVIYHSFYSTSSLTNKSSKADIWNMYKNTLVKAIAYLSGKDSENLFLSQKGAFYKQFYDYMKENSPDLANSYPLTPKFTKQLSVKNFHEKVLQYIANNHEKDYYLMQLKYYIQHYQMSGNIINNIVFIFDDIEALKVEYHEQAIDMAYHIKKCISAYKSRNFDIKILISLRNYSFRLNQERQKAAFREIDDSDIILKKDVAKLSEVISKRTQAIIEHSDTIKGLVEIDSWKEASASLMIILKKLYGNYDEILLNLTHYNIFNSMRLLLRIITNKRYLGKHEKYGRDGAFTIDPLIYDLSNKDARAISNSDVFNSLVYGEGEHYYDYGDYYLPNVLHYSKDQSPDSRILKLYILKYFLVSQNKNRNSLYGIYYEKGCEVVNHICNIFKNENPIFRDRIRCDIKDAMSYLYIGGVLLQSIKDNEHKDNSRKYHEEAMLYLSLRGTQIISMLEANALLFEAYRNDIDTNLNHNTVPSVNLSKEDSLAYCIEYTHQLFSSELNYINQVDDTDGYYSIFDHDFIVSSLIKGLKESVNLFYENSPEKFAALKSKLNCLIKTVNDKADELNRTENFCFNRLEI